ncbi:MAG: ABC transporter substrate binding protein, partial [Pseudolabrys sp.]
ANGLYVCADPLMVAEQVRVATLVQGARLPSISGLGGYAEAGGLISYGASFADLFRRAGDYVDKILRGAKPADIPIEQPTKFLLAVNLKTAKALGLEVPANVLALADEVIE